AHAAPRARRPAAPHELSPPAGPDADARGLVRKQSQLPALPPAWIPGRAALIGWAPLGSAPGAIIHGYRIQREHDHGELHGDLLPEGKWPQPVALRNPAKRIGCASG